MKSRQVYRLVWLKVKSLRHQIQCIYVDLLDVISNYARFRKEATKEVAFIHDKRFFSHKNWQVVSQCDLWYKFVEEHQPILCGSFLSYYLFARKAKYVVSLEPGYNAPKFNFSKHHKKVIVLLSDSHSKKWFYNYSKKSNVTDVITPYKKTLEYTGYASFIKESFIHSFPWCISDDIVLQTSIVQDEGRIMSFGNVAVEDAYDLRRWVFESGVLKSFDYAGSGNQKYKGQDYYHWLRGFDATVVAMSTHKLYNYTVAKYFEVLSQGHLLFAFPTVDLKDHGFIDGVNCILVSKENFKEKIDAYLQNPMDYIDIRNNGLQLIKTKHTVSHRLAQLASLLSE